jgi:micrococcal nuclease
MRRSRALPLLVALGLLAALAGVLRNGEGGGGGSERRARVVKVVDGDTVHVRLDGRTQSLRYIGMDTPEDKKPGVGVRCWSLRAAADNARLVSGREVTLKFDRNPRDRYGRLLAYVYRAGDGLFVNAELVRLGDARERPFPDNRAHRDEFARLASAARARGTGLWRHCGRGGRDAF